MKKYLKRTVFFSAAMTILPAVFLAAALFTGCTRKNSAAGAEGVQSAAGESVAGGEKSAGEQSVAGSERSAGKQTGAKKYPQSIVALSPAAVEILYAVGAQDQISAVSDFCDYPQQAKEKPVVGGFDGKTLSLEKILSYKPDFLYLTDGMHNFLIDELNKYDIKYYLSNASSIAAVEKEISEIGELTGHKEQAEKVVEQMEEKLAPFANMKNNKARKPEVYYEVWNSPYISAGSLSFINDVIEKAGGNNIFSDIQEMYPIVSEETLISKKPMVILITASSGVTVQNVMERHGWSELPAVLNNQIYVIDDNLYSRPGPRVADCVVELNKLLW